MDTKQKLLLFLYENRHSSHHLEINHIFKDCELDQIDIVTLIGDLKTHKIIETRSKYALLGVKSFTFPERLPYNYTTDNVKLKAKLTPIIGEQYVRDNYLTQHSNPTITATQVIYAKGDINAPISQTNDHSSSTKKATITPNKNPPKTLIKKLFSIKNMVIIISTLVGGLILYFMTKYFETN